MGASQAVRKLNCDLQAWLFAATQVRCVQEHWQAVVEPRAAQRVSPPRHLHLDSVTVPPGTSTLSPSCTTCTLRMVAGLFQLGHC